VLERGGVARQARIAAVSPIPRGRLLLAFTGITDRNAAEALAGHRILVAEADLPPLGADEFYHHELVGFAVDTIGGEHLGAVVETFSTGLNDVWVVRDAAREYLIPVIADVVRTIDRDARRIVVDPIPGLLD